MLPYRHLSRLVLVVCGHACALQPVSGADTSAPSYGTIELVRDRWGVPHVFAQSDEGAMYGLGYATAEDRGFQMYYTLRTIQGRLAEVIGDVKNVRGNDTAVNHDRRMRTFGFYRAAQGRVERLDAESAALLKAYAQGVNAYFDQHRDSICPLFDKTGLRPEPWTAADCLVSWWHLGQFFATDGTRDLLQYRNLAAGPAADRAPAGGGGARGAGRDPRGVRAAAAHNLTPVPPDEASAVVGPEDVSQQWLEQAHAFLATHGYPPQPAARGQGDSSAPKFSHAWVIGGQVSGTGAAVLVSMPQTPVANPSLLYEFHIRGKTFDAQRRRRARIARDSHRLESARRLGYDGPGGGPGGPVPAKDRPPASGPVSVRWAMAAHGAGVRVDRGQGRAVAVPRGPPDSSGPDRQRVRLCPARRSARGTETDPSLRYGSRYDPGALAMFRAADASEFHAALAGWRFPSANVVFGDSRGQVGYSVVGTLPLRPAGAWNEGGAAHDGSASAHDWQAMVPQDLLPHILNPQEGYLFSGNHRPVGSFYPIPIGISTGSMGDTLRPGGCASCSRAKSRSRPSRHWRCSPTRPTRPGGRLPASAITCATCSGASCRPAQCWRSSTWKVGMQGSPSRLDVPGAELSMQISTFFRMVTADLAMVYGGGEAGLSHLLKTIGRRLDDDPRADVQPLEQQFVDQSLANAWDQAQRAYGPDPERWIEAARRQVTDRKIGAVREPGRLSQPVPHAGYGLPTADVHGRGDRVFPGRPSVCSMGSVGGCRPGPLAAPARPVRAVGKPLAHHQCPGVDQRPTKPGTHHAGRGRAGGGPAANPGGRAADRRLELESRPKCHVGQSREAAPSTAPLAGTGRSTARPGHPPPWWTVATKAEQLAAGMITMSTCVKVHRHKASGAT